MFVSAFANINFPYSSNRDFQVLGDQLLAQNLFEPVEIIAAKCRPDIIKWIDTVPTAGRGPALWRGDLLQMLVRQIVSTSTKDSREMLASAKPILMAKHPDMSSAIEKTINKYLVKSPVEGFLKSKAYQWLKFLSTNPPKDSSWYPHLAVEVAHRAFRLKGKLATLRVYLEHPSRSKQLKLVVKGMS